MKTTGKETKRKNRVIEEDKKENVREASPSKSEEFVSEVLIEHEGASVESSLHCLNRSSSTLTLFSFKTLEFNYPTEAIC
jgi:hypothetical protein